MLWVSICIAMLTLPARAWGESNSADSQMAQAMLIEIRQLRQDLQITAATIQRVQIAMYRMQAESAQLDRATQRVEFARSMCMGTQQQKKMNASQMEQAEARKASAQNPAEQKHAEQQIAQLRSFTEQLASQEQQCQVEQAEAEGELRTEQAKMNDLQDQLDRLDKTLAVYGKK